MAKTEKLEVPRWELRLAGPADSEFVLDSWLKTAHRTYPNQYATDFFSDARARVQRILDASVNAVAHVAGMPDELLGHIVYGAWRKMLVLHYAFVKPDARRHGVFRSMLDFANYQQQPIVLTSP